MKSLSVLLLVCLLLAQVFAIKTNTDSNAFSKKVNASLETKLTCAVNNCQKSACYLYNEGPNGNRCNHSCQCDGNRTCSQFGWCQGTSR